MRISINWLRELVDINVPPEQLAETLTMAGFEVEDIEDRRTWADGVVIGKILSCDPHPNADKLRVCQVDLGTTTPANIVCGASNARSGIQVAVATPGTYLPQIDLKIRPTKLRGVPSEGMICSLAELGLAKESAGIHIFDQEDLSLGSDVRPLLGLDDVILDVTSTANRADALSMVGIAREVAALTGGTLRLPGGQTDQIPGEPLNNSALLSLKVSEPQACPSYIGTVITGVQTGPSPEWLQRRLQAAGLRPINNVVDITNYILLEWGQPLHAFDRDRLVGLAGQADLTIGVRFAQAGESLKTLDGQTRTLQTQNLLITANDHPIALAGVMGGEETEVHAGSQNLVLEAAIFEPIVIRRSARSQALRTEASARYERGVNQAELSIACGRALQLITELAGGTIVAQTRSTALTDSTHWVRSIELRLDRINQILGPIEVGDDVGDLQANVVERILTTLGCTITPTETERVWMVTVPPYRYRDLEREIDLIEEVARLYGYNNFCDTLPNKTEPGYLSLEQELTRKLRACLRAEGLTELMHYSLVKTGGSRQIALANPLFTEYSALRTHLLPDLIDAFQYNLEQGNGPLNGFEIGRVFWSEEDGLSEADAVAGVLGGDPKQGKWPQGGRDQPMTWYEAKGVLDAVFQRLGLPIEYQPDQRDPLLHPGRTASLWIRGNHLGTFGQLHPQVRQERGLPDAIYAFELNQDVILDFMDQDEYLTPLFRAYSTFPASDRDLAFFAATKISVAELIRVMTKAGGQLLESVEVFDEYRGEHVPPGQRSLAFRLTYRATDRTLTDAEIEPLHQQVREALVDKFRVELRS
ncbi:phenylalanine--tRNA ligase subunit beta [Leptolyngbya sp. 'hensonii']|uniref:phenylalanine--tRNA ligase subunit beta n=1 Tax=Leptolyngbya sp. 'hensonii' TaxID=1922337 RepID=UPI00094F7BFF|nr:phenylalanine--tRNA ligase subunit beta [Leptolyngbya sp. 'hensonii']OLP19288.1 phenylalanine--tRNA ligase subunit beta [Leptolyngbya sp. 'hensonii']